MAPLFPFGNLHPQLTSRNSPLILREIGLHTSMNPVVKRLVSQIPKLENSQRLTFSLLISYFFLSRFWRLRCRETHPLDPEDLIYRNFDALASFDFSIAPHSVGISDFAISQILMQRIRVFTPQNPKMVNGV
jgi:hypothetical protein